MTRSAQGGVTIGRRTSMAGGPTGPTLGEDGQVRATQLPRETPGQVPFVLLGGVARPATGVAPVLPKVEVVPTGPRPPLGLETLRVFAGVHAAPRVARRVPPDAMGSAVGTTASISPVIGAVLATVAQAHTATAMAVANAPPDPKPARHLTRPKGDAGVVKGTPRPPSEAHTKGSARKTTRRSAAGPRPAVITHAVRASQTLAVAAARRLRVMARVPVGRIVAGLHRARGDTLPDGVPPVAGRALPRRARRPPHGLPPAALQVAVLATALPSLAGGRQIRRVRQVRRPSPRPAA